MLNKSHLAPTHATAPKKRKASADLDRAADRRTTPKQAKLSEKGTDRKIRMQSLLGEGNTQENNLKAVEDRFAWLSESKVRDAAGRPPSDKDHDARTVQIPRAAWEKLSASQKQYWEVKKSYRDVILFFRVGSFYELYEEDAQIGADVLGWKLTLTGVGACRQVGCSTNGIDEAVARLTAAGYKVGRMEQLETAAEAKAKRGPKATIQRKLMRIHSPALPTGSIGADSVTLLALFERETDRDVGMLGSAVTFGFAFLDAAAGRFYVGSVSDDAGRANLSAVLTQVAPKEVVFGRNALSKSTMRRLASPPVPMQLSPADAADFAEDRLEGVEKGEPLSAAAHKELFGCLRLPQGSGAECMAPQALSALAGLVSHLRRLNADSELASENLLVVPYQLFEGALCLDGPTLQNLDLLENQDDGASKGSLLSVLDNCASAGGKRLLRVWLCRPLRHIPAINARLDAVQELSDRPELIAEFREALQKVGDLERLLGRVRNACTPPSEGLPEWIVRAAQSKRLLALSGAIQGVQAAIQALQVLTRPCEGGPAAAQLLLEAAASIPRSQDLAVLDDIQACLRVASVQKGKKGKGQSAEGTVSLTDAFLASQPASEGEIDGEDGKLWQEIKATTVLLADFVGGTHLWEALEGALSSVDVLCSFAAFTALSAGPSCRPHFVEPGPSGVATLELEQLWHPCAVVASGGSVVPNDLTLGSSKDEARSLLLTGPNMGGKSTLLRATCCATIMAQIGCWVPAAAATLSPADRIFTRIGAQDRIVAGESTFLVECNEASAILRHATPHSLIVLDELGRGTSTFDGYAIAYSVLAHLSKLRCRMIFATHYHPLTAEFQGSPQVKLGYMAAAVATSSQASSGLPCITFLYKLLQGTSPESYGLQVAQLAGMPDSILARAQEKGAELEAKIESSFAGAREQISFEEEQALKHAFRHLGQACG